GDRGDRRNAHASAFPLAGATGAVRRGRGVTMSTALVIDYTPAIANLLKTILRTVGGFDRVDTALRGDTAARLLDRTDYDLVILEPVVPFGDERLLTWL